MPGDARTPAILDLLIIGAGISGIGMAARLHQTLPDKSYAILERRDDLGGTWDLFRYPGVRSDSDMYTLGYDFAPWLGDRAVASGHEILGYLRDVADRYDVTSHIRLGTEVMSANWDWAERCWTVRTTGPDGECAAWKSRFLFCGSGYYDYAHPAPAEIPGIGHFSGQVIHPQFWPEGTDLAGKDVAVIGSGATAVTLVPALARTAKSVTMIQRTPGWYMAQPSHDPLAGILRRLLPESWAYRLVRAKNNALQHWFYRRARNKGEEVGDYLLNRVRSELGNQFDPADFSPPFGPWEQRLCFVPDSDFFAAIRDGKAHIATGRINGLTSDKVILDDGREIPADVIITATGLRLSVFGGIRISVAGEPVDFSQTWYYRSHMLSNVPNFAALFGYLNAAWTLRVDLVTKRLCRLLEQMDAWGADIAVPRLPEDHKLVEADPLAGFSSGYLQRGRHLIPKSATNAPWRLSHDYFADAREMRNSPIDDGVLHFKRPPASSIAVAADGQLP